MILHVACLPFPSHQGTQAALDAMLRAWSTAGHPADLLTYAHGAYTLDAPYEIHRAPDFPKVRSLRSGPSWGKVALDLGCVASTRALAHRLRPRAIVAHHIEAAVTSLAAAVAPVYYLAHTSLLHELPVYFPQLASGLVGAIGHAAERWVCGRAASVAAVAPSLADLLPNARYVPVPWPCSVDRVPKDEARAALELPSDARVCLYAGNLDRYQGWEHLIDAIARLRRIDSRARLLIATESDTAAARTAARALDLADAVDFRGLSSERARMHAHAAADVAWVPRRSKGGLPIKMLDAFSRQVPVVAMERATAALPVVDSCALVPNDDPDALATSAARLFDDVEASEELCQRASEYLASHHSPKAYVDAVQDWLGAASTTQGPAKQRVQRPRAARELQARRARPRCTSDSRRAHRTA